MISSNRLMTQSQSTPSPLVNITISLEEAEISRPTHIDKRMEATKLSCFLTKFKANADKIVRTMESLEARARECYEEASDRLNSQEFVEMMVYDACFIVLLIRGDSVPNIFKERGIRDEIVNDLLLFENQLPFFVISKLYHIIMERDVHQLARDALSLLLKN
ncbi:hypothetical protein V6N13_069441 [Hibiscus sabdariffa]